MADQLHPSGAAYATWWSRVGAEIIDGLLVTLPVGIVLFVLGVDGSAFLSVLAMFAYNGVLDGSERGQTVGKMALGIRARTEESGEELGASRGFSRAMLPAAFGAVGLFDSSLGFLGAMLSLASSLWPLWDPRRQTWHDKVARSVVLKVAPPTYGDLADEPIDLA